MAMRFFSLLCYPVSAASRVPDPFLPFLSSKNKARICGRSSSLLQLLVKMDEHLDHVIKTFLRSHCDEICHWFSGIALEMLLDQIFHFVLAFNSLEIWIHSFLCYPIWFIPSNNVLILHWLFWDWHIVVRIAENVIKKSVPSRFTIYRYEDGHSGGFRSRRIRFRGKNFYSINVKSYKGEEMSTK